MRHRAVIMSDDADALTHLHDHLYEYALLEDREWIGPGDSFPDGRVTEGEPSLGWLEQVALDGGGTTCYRHHDKDPRTFRVTVEEVNL